MSALTQSPVLIIGGSGVVGSRAARALRRLQPSLPITLGARDLVRAGALAKEVGGADAVHIDLERPDLGLPAEATFSAVVVFLKDTSFGEYRVTRGDATVSIPRGELDTTLYTHHFIAGPSLRLPLLP